LNLKIVIRFSRCAALELKPNAAKRRLKRANGASRLLGV
jgi:hypothetical protein